MILLCFSLTGFSLLICLLLILKRVNFSNILLKHYFEKSLNFEEKIEELNKNVRNVETNTSKCMCSQGLETNKFLLASCCIIEEKVKDIYQILTKIDGGEAEEKLTEMPKEKKKRTEESRELSAKNMKRIWEERQKAKEAVKNKTERQVFARSLLEEGYEPKSIASILKDFDRRLAHVTQQSTPVQPLSSLDASRNTP